MLEAAGIERSLLGLVKKRKLSYFGHVMRKNEDCIEKEIMQGTVPGTKARERPRMRWMDNMGAWTGLSTRELLERVKDRKV